jgi:hypothetical protein
MEKFYNEVRRIGKPNAVIALITYGVLHVEGEAIDAIVQEFYWKTIGPYWPAERRHVEEGYRNLPFPFHETKIPDLAIEVQWRLQDLIGYTKTWSAVTAAAKALGTNPVEQFEATLRKQWGDPEFAPPCCVAIVVSCGKYWIKVPNQRFDLDAHTRAIDTCAIDTNKTQMSRNLNTFLSTRTAMTPHQRLLNSTFLTFLFIAVTLASWPARAEDTPTTSTNAVTTNAVTMLYLTRTGERCSATNKTGKVALAKRGILQAGTLSFYTIERIGTVSLRRGTYQCVMEQQLNPDGSGKRKVFRPRAEGPYGHHLKSSTGGPAAILIHSANTPHQLTGCIAPGRQKTPEGVDESIPALKAIFDACGGFVDGKVVWLVVRN